MNQQSPAEPGKSVVTYPTADFPAGEMIFEQGDGGAFMYLIQEGQVEILQSSGGRHQRSAVLEKGDFFGEMSLFDETSRSHSVRAVTAVRLVQIDRHLFQHMLHRNPEIAIRMIRKLAGRLSETEDRLLSAYLDETPKAAAKAPRYELRGRLTQQDENGTVFELPDKPVISIGRLDPTQSLLPDLDLTAVDLQTSTSRRHARILRQGDRFSIMEEQATNGTFVNGQRIEVNEPLELRSGDLVQFGSVCMVFSIDVRRTG